MQSKKLRELIETAILTVLSREGDIDTDDGSFATVGTDEIIRLDCAIADAFELNSDDVNESDVALIKYKLDSMFK
jgi:hypothetical protein